MRRDPGGLEHLVEAPRIETPAARLPKGRSAKETKPPASSTVSRAQLRANILMLCMNTAEAPLNEAGVRKGIRQAINTGALERSINSPRWKERYRFCPSVMDRFPLAEVPTPFNVDEARAALANHTCRLQLDYLAGAGRSAVAIWLARQLADFGITLKLNAASSGRVFFERLEKREHQLALATFSSDYLHPHSNAHALCANSDWEYLNTFDGRIRSPGIATGVTRRS